MSRLEDIHRLYSLLSRLEERVGGKRRLQDFSRFRDWPIRGVYIFFEPGEIRSNTGEGLRVVRVGTHALRDGSRSTLRQRLNQHRGTTNGGGNHRGSIFRLLVGQAMIAKGQAPACPSWGVKSDVTKAGAVMKTSRAALREAEWLVELAVSRYIGSMPFLWLDISDEPSNDSHRGYIERNLIALLSNSDKQPVDPPSANWLGRHSNRNAVLESGLWNQRHVHEDYEPEFIDKLGHIAGKTV